METLDRGDSPERSSAVETAEGSIGRPGREIGEGTDGLREDEQTAQPRDVAAAIDEGQVEVGAEAIRANSERLEPRAWEAASAEEQLRTLQDVENLLAAHEGREPLPVRAADLPRGLAGQCDGTQIEVGRAYLGNPEAASRTVLHESRHAYQVWAMGSPEAGEPRAAAWRESRDAYVEPLTEDSGQTWALDQVRLEQYSKNGLEVDAFAYEDRVVSEMESHE